MHTLLCQDLLAELEPEGSSNPDRTRTVILPDHTTGKHLESAEGHTVHISSDGAIWPCDCRV